MPLTVKQLHAHNPASFVVSFRRVIVLCELCGRRSMGECMSLAGEILSKVSKERHQILQCSQDFAQNVDMFMRTAVQDLQVHAQPRGSCSIFTDFDLFLLLGRALITNVSHRS